MSLKFLGSGEGREGVMVLSVVTGFVVGAFIGSSFGIAGFGSAIAGTVAFGLLGAYIGYRLNKSRSEKRALAVITDSDEES